MADLDLHSWRSPGDSVFPRPKPGRTSLHRADPYECLGLHQFPKCFQIYANRLWKTMVDIGGVWYGIRSEPQEFCHHPKVWSKSASSLSSIIIYIRSSWKLRLNWKLQTPAQNCGKCGYQGNSKFNKLMEESNAENLCNFLVVP